MREGEENTACCASCSIAEVDDIKLKDCNACKSVGYCSDKCQREHKPTHEQDCEKRAAELRDEILFEQPGSSYWGDCPICCLPLPLDAQKFTLMACCCKLICNGCEYANLIRELKGSLELKCAFCRHPRISDEELELNLMKRVEANDSAAMCQMGGYRRNEGDYITAFQNYSKAAELGDAHAHYLLTQMYYNGEGAEKDEKKEVYHLEQAAIEGHVLARNNLGCVEEENGRMERAAKHWIIAVNLGHSHSLDAVKSCYRQGFVSKEDLAKALRAHQAALDAMKSPQRDEAIAIRDHMKLKLRK